MSKMLKITMIIVITFFSIILTPHERASANPLAVGGALYLGGAGVYVVGAVGIAAIAGIAGCDSCEADINEHAARTWDGSTQIVKDGVQLMVDASVGAWGATSSALTAVDANVNTWMDGQISNIVAEAMNSKYAYDSITANTTINYIRYQNWRQAVSNQEKYFLVKGQLVNELQLIDYGASKYVTLNFNYAAAGSVNPPSITLWWSDVPGLRAMFDSISSSSGVVAMASFMGASIGYATKNDYVSDFASASANATEAWEEMTDAGLVLPVDLAKPMIGDIPLTYDPVTDAYSGIDGITVPHDKVTGFDFGKVNWKSLNDLSALGLTGLGAGLYIDGMTGNPSTTSTYDPATDMTTTSTTSTGTTTNVTTGETVTTGTTTTTSTTTGDTTGNPAKTPEGTTPKTQTGKSNRWGKLVTTKFPFSLPWDLFFVLSFLNADPKTPVFSIDERINKRENVEGIQIKFDIDLSFLDPYVPWFRRLIVLGFALFLILNTRKLLGGAQ